MSIATIVTAALSAPHASFAAAPQVTVTLASGRTFTAAIDARTDGTTLWLRFDSAGGIVLRPVAWDRVTSAEGPQGVMTTDELRKQLPNLVSSVDVPKAGGNTATDTAQPVEAVSAPETVAPSLVSSIHADAFVAHWGPNVEADGIALTLSPLDEYGRRTPVDGTLEVELIADYRSYLRPAPLTTREPFNRIGSWTFRLTPEDFAGGRATLRLPFQAIDPQFTRNVDSYGLVTMRLAVPGQGVFATSVGDVRIRPLNNIRDRIENSTGARFLPGEQTGRPVRTGTWPY